MQYHIGIRFNSSHKCDSSIHDWDSLCKHLFQCSEVLWVKTQCCVPARIQMQVRTTEVNLRLQFQTFEAQNVTRGTEHTPQRPAIDWGYFAGLGWQVAHIGLAPKKSLRSVPDLRTNAWYKCVWILECLYPFFLLHLHSASFGLPALRQKDIRSMSLLLSLGLHKEDDLQQENHSK